MGKRNLKELKIIEEFCKGKILDLGCADGQVLNYLYEKGFHDLKGMDISKNLIEKAKQTNKNIYFEVGNAEKKNISEKYDSILLIGILEYLDMLPFEMLVKLTKNLSSKGVIICEVPNANSFRRRIKCLFGLEPIDSFSKNKVYYFTRKRIIDSVEKAGFQLTKLTTPKFDVIKNRKIPMPDSLASEFFFIIKKKEMLNRK